MKIVKVIKSLHNKTWYASKIGKMFKTMDKQEHHQGSHHGNIYVTINPEFGWIHEEDVIIKKNSWWNRLFSK